MANIRKPRVPKEEQLKLINECRSSGMTDIDWCREHGIAVSTFYYWVKQLRRESAQIPEPAYGHSDNPRPRQDVVPIDIIPEHFPLQYNNPSPDTYHTLEIILGSATIRVSDKTDPEGRCMLGDISGLERIYIVCGYTVNVKSCASP